MSNAERVLIVGGGIAGMALAIVLQRAGIAAEIAEIDKDWRVYGAGITITGPTLRALDRLGLLDAVVSEGYCYDATRICDAAGNVIMASRVSGRPMGPRIPNGGGILRPVLHRILVRGDARVGRRGAARRQRRRCRADGRRRCRSDSPTARPAPTI